MDILQDIINHGKAKSKHKTLWLLGDKDANLYRVTKSKNDRGETEIYLSHGYEPLSKENVAAKAIFNTHKDSEDEKTMHLQLIKVFAHKKFKTVDGKRVGVGITSYYDSGLASQLLKFCEYFAYVKGYEDIRGEVINISFRPTEKTLRFYNRNGYNLNYVEQGNFHTFNKTIDEEKQLKYEQDVLSVKVEDKKVNVVVFDKHKEKVRQAIDQQAKEL